MAYGKTVKKSRLNRLLNIVFNKLFTNQHSGYIILNNKLMNRSSNLDTELPRELQVLRMQQVKVKANGPARAGANRVISVATDGNLHPLPMEHA